MSAHSPDGSGLRVTQQAGAEGLGPWATVTIGLIWAVTLTRAVPVVEGDYGVFVSVAERLVAGDRLYVDVWDNKDPFFFYALALGRSVTPFAGVMLEAIWLVTAALAVVVVGTSLGISRTAAMFAGLGMTPLVVTGSAYLAGYTHLPGTALALAALAATVARRPILAGIALALLAFTKLVLLPVGMVAVVVALVMRRRGGDALRSAISFGAAVAATAAVMGLRGEFLPYLDTLADNVSYSRSDVLETDWGPFVGHILLVVDRAGQTTLVMVALVLMVALVRHRAAVPPAEPTDHRILWAVAAATTLAGLAVIGFTGFWPHHGQALYAGAALVALVATAGLTGLAPMRSLLSIGSAVAVGLLLAGGPDVVSQVQGSRAALEGLRSAADMPPSAIAIRALGPSGEYARVGGSDDGHAFGLGQWDLACPRFHQYFFQSSEQLDPVADCIRGSDVVLVAPDARPVPGWFDWNTYLRDVESFLAADYTCERGDFGRVCVKNATGP